MKNSLRILLAVCALVLAGCSSYRKDRVIERDLLVPAAQQSEPAAEKKVDA